jgi:methionyl-tRNA synthetase
LKKTDIARMGTVLYVLAETLRYLGVTLQPFMPDSAGALLDQLAVPASTRDFAHLTQTHALKPGTALPAPQGIFPRYVESAA